MFDLFKQDTDEVIMIINYYIMLSDEKPTETTAPTRRPVGKRQERIRVNDATATGGWF